MSNVLRLNAELSDQALRAIAIDGILNRYVLLALQLLDLHPPAETLLRIQAVCRCHNSNVQCPMSNVQCSYLGFRDLNCTCALLLYSSRRFPALFLNAGSRLMLYFRRRSPSRCSPSSNSSLLLLKPLLALPLLQTLARTLSGIHALKLIEPLYLHYIVFKCVLYHF